MEFQKGDKVSPSSMGIAAGLKPERRFIVEEDSSGDTVVVKLGRKKKACPAKWFQVVETAESRIADKAAKQEFQIGEYVEFQAFQAGVGAHPKGEIIGVVRPTEDAFLILKSLFPAWEERYRFWGIRSRAEVPSVAFRP